MSMDKAQWEQCLDALQTLGGTATSQQVWEYLKQFRADLPPSSINDNLRMLAVNSPSRTSHIAGREPRRTDTGNRYDRLYMEGSGADANFVFYDPAKHGLWEVYKDDSATSTHKTSIQRADEALAQRILIDVLPANISHNHFPAKHFDGSFFPVEMVRAKDPDAPGLSAVFYTDAGTQFNSDIYMSSRNSGYLHSRSPAGEYFRAKSVQPGDQLRYDKVGARAFRISHVPRRADIVEPERSTKEISTVITQPLNQILYGPPGTGKTYATIDKALAILEPDFNGSREQKKQKFDAYAAAGQIKFVTFHQSFSYEDFVEGIRAGTNEATRQIEYAVEDGVFKQLCNAAQRRVVQSTGKHIDLKGRRIWKISLGEAGTEEAVYEDCIKQGLALIGFGADADYNGVQTRDDIAQRFQQATPERDASDYPITALNIFIRQVKIGDLFVVTQGNLRFRAIGEVTSEYLHVPRENDSYSQGRKINWLRVYDAGLPYAELMENRFSQMTIYELRPGSINLDKLTKLLASAEETQDNAPRVLIIDEINRGNISRVFGELITLIEESKRAGKPEALEVTLPYSQDKFSVPDNVYLVGTMNTADRSLAGLDVALRRRFVFEEMLPRPDLLGMVSGIDLQQLLAVMNNRIEVLLGRDHLLGHAYFIGIQSLHELKSVFQRQILPLLQEYFFEDWERIALVLNDPRKAKAHQFLSKPVYDEHALFGKAGFGNGSRWQINAAAFEAPESYLGIYTQIEAIQ